MLAPNPSCHVGNESPPPIIRRVHKLQSVAELSTEIAARQANLDRLLGILATMRGDTDPSQLRPADRDRLHCIDPHDEVTLYAGNTAVQVSMILSEGDQ